jgi:hypothetical protein
MVGATIEPAAGGMPWKHNDRQATMHGQALPEEEVSEEAGSDEDLSEADLAGWQGMSSTIPAIDVAERSFPFMVAA